MRIALTGATGFVGQHVLPRLLARGWEVSVLARDPSRLGKDDGLTVVAGDLANKDALAQLCEGADAVLHAAGAISSVDENGFDRVNRIGTRDVMVAARQAGVRRFVHVSSLAAREPGLSPYAASKAAAERVMQDAGDGISTLILRPAAIYGEGDKATLPLLKALMSRIAVLPGRRDNRFSLVHVDDFAEICAAALVSDTAGVVDIGGDALTWDDVARTTQVLHGRPARLVLLPKPVAMMIGWCGETWSRFTGKPAMVNRGKMREFYHADWTVAGGGWPGVKLRSLGSGLASTISWYQDKGLIRRSKGPAHD